MNTPPGHETSEGGATSSTGMTWVEEPLDSSASDSSSIIVLDYEPDEELEEDTKLGEDKESEEDKELDEDKELEKDKELDDNDDFEDVGSVGSSIDVEMLTEEMRLALELQQEWRIDGDPIWDPIRPFTRELAALQALRPGFFEALRRQVLDLTHRGERQCPIYTASKSHTRYATSIDVHDIPSGTDRGTQTEPKTRSEVGTQTDSTPSVVEAGCQTMNQPPSSTGEPRPLHSGLPLPKPGPPTVEPVPSGSRDRNPHGPTAIEGPSARAPGPRYGHCFNCGSPAHKKANCPAPPSPHCFRCGYPGVTLRDCPLHGVPWRAAGPYVPWLGQNLPRDVMWSRDYPQRYPPCPENEDQWS